MFGAEPYQFEPTYRSGEEPAHGEGEERSALPEPVRIENVFLLTDVAISQSDFPIKQKSAPLVVIAHSIHPIPGYLPV